ncbi:MAG: alpha/beta fold hydrolase [Gemmatimonadota bacterium]|nr:MAG: alpha/beta fold hydrolase [Gemmatimonadota bacterium]
MTTPHRVRPLPYLISLTCLSLIGSPAAAQQRESILDSIVHLEDSVVTRVPEVPRLEEGLELRVRRIDVGDAELYVEEEGSGIPLVLINGGPGGTHHYFHPWFGRARDFARVIYYDQRGTGLSDYEPGPDGYSVEQAVDDLEALRLALGIDRWVLLGFSYGGFLAQYYTTTYPQRVAGLVLVGASPGLWADLGSSHQYDYISQAEVDRMREVRAKLRELRDQEGWSPEKYLQLIVYNNHINGDWKRQNFYKPTADELAQVALYEWVQDANFNSIMSQSQQKVDLTGAFDRNPIPTLLLEGKWDLTWGDAKATILSRNHPNARMVVIEDAGHSIYDENSEVFFTELESFVSTLTPVTASDIEAYQQHLAVWRANWQSSPMYTLRTAGWGLSGSRQIAKAYRAEWLDEISATMGLLRVGLALYDTENYEGALRVFTRLQELSEAKKDNDRLALALIWQGQMLDLLDRRDEAIARYQRVVDMDSKDLMRHDQYGLSFEYSPYAAERLKSPFQRVENKQP